MNIAEAKNQIEETVEGYLTRDETGAYLIAPEAQRPLFLLGAPGIGKTAVVGQVARELGIGLMSYSMTHHTRQSALGLPFIVHKRYGDEEFDVSEYTMSEIIASIYDYREETGHDRGNPLSRRNQLRVGNALSLDAAVSAVQDFRAT